MKTILLTLLIVLAASPAHALSGRWITQSGNLEIEIAPCGDALCGTAVKVLANHSMSNAGAEMADTGIPALGLKVLGISFPTATTAGPDTSTIAKTAKPTDAA
jgi:hypothetical protein